MKASASALSHDRCVPPQKEKSCDNIPKEPVVFEKMKLVSASFAVDVAGCEGGGLSAFRVK